MGNLFRYDGPVGRWIGRVSDLIVLNVVYVLCCLPVFTIGAATSALYYVTLRMVQDEEGGIVKNFFHAFRSNFGQSSALTGIWLGSGGLILLVLYMYNHMDMGIWSAGKYLLYVALLIHLVVFTYVFPVFARFDNTIKNTIKNSCKLAATYPVNTLAVSVVNGMPLILDFFWPEIFSHIFFLWLFLLFAVQAYWNAGLFRRIFDQLESAKEVEEEETESSTNQI